MMKRDAEKQIDSKRQNDSKRQDADLVFSQPNNPQASGFMFARFISEQGAVEPLSFETLHQFAFPNHTSTQAQGYVWLHLDRDDPHVMDWLTHEPLIDDIVVETLAADDSRPRTIIHDDGVLLNLRGVNLNPSKKPEDMLPVRLWLHEHVVITVQIEKLKSIDDLLHQVDTGEPPRTQAEFVADLANLLLDNMASTIAHLEARIDDIEQVVFQDKDHDLSQELSYIRRTAIMLHRYLAPQKVALSSFSKLDSRLLTGSAHTPSTQLDSDTLSEQDHDDRFRLADVTDQTARIIEELVEVRERASIVHEYMAEQHIEQMNKTMLLLAIVSVMFIPMTLISGLFGMNVGGLPWTDNAMGFAYTLVVIGLTGLVTFVVLKLFKMF